MLSGSGRRDWVLTHPGPAARELPHESRQEARGDQPQPDVHDPVEQGLFVEKTFGCLQHLVLVVGRILGKIQTLQEIR